MPQKLGNNVPRAKYSGNWFKKILLV
jgi:hypothetical protein